MCDCEGGLVRAICIDDAEVTRRGGGLQSRIQWARLPPASLNHRDNTTSCWLAIENRAGLDSGWTRESIQCLS